jgi:hypothetical protein
MTHGYTNREVYMILLVKPVARLAGHKCLYCMTVVGSFFFRFNRLISIHMLYFCLSSSWIVHDY